MESLQHSSLGSHWTKKNHKYLYKEGNRYIYPSDLKKMGSSRSVDENSASYGTRETETNNRLDALERKKARENHYETVKRKRFDDQQKELLDRANENRTKSATGRTARDIISDKGTKRVMYQTSNKDGRSITKRREAGIKTGYDDRGYKTSEAYAKDSQVENRAHKSGTARDIINKKGTRRVEYEDAREGRKRRVTNKDYSKTVDRLTKNGAFKKKLWDMQKSIERGKKAKEIKKQQKEKEKQIPLSMRWKRDKKRFKRFFNKK